MTLAAEPVLNGSWPGYFWTEDGDHVPGRLVLENGSCLIETVQEVVSLKDYAVHSSNPHMGESRISRSTATSALSGRSPVSTCG